MATTAITGKKCTFTYATVAGTAQITSASIDESASSETIQTLGGSVAVSQGVESTVSADFLYEPQTGGFYGALKAALQAGTAGTLDIKAGSGSPPTGGWSGQAIVTSLGVEIPADGAMTCTAELTISGSLPWTAGTLLAADDEGAVQEQEQPA